MFDNELSMVPTFHISSLPLGDQNSNALKDAGVGPSLNLKEHSYYKVFPTVITWFSCQKLHLRRKEENYFINLYPGLEDC